MTLPEAAPAPVDSAAAPAPATPAPAAPAVASPAPPAAAPVADAPATPAPAAPAVLTGATPARRYLFVCGCPRSGTTAMWRTMAGSVEVVLGVERYATRMHDMDASMFEKDRFLTAQPGDTFYDDLETFSAYYRGARQRFDFAKRIGDKSPRLYDHFDNLAKNFPGATVLIMYRNIYDVAASYKRRAQDERDETWGRGQGVDAAINDWTRSIKAFLKYSENSQLDLVPVCYEQLFSQGEGLEALFDRIGVTLDAGVRTQYERLMSKTGNLEAARDKALSTQEIFDISMRAPFGGYRTIIEKALQVAKA